MLKSFCWISFQFFQIIIPLRCAVEISDSSDDQSVKDEDDIEQQHQQQQQQQIGSYQKLFFDQLAAIQVKG